MYDTYLLTYLTRMIKIAVQTARLSYARYTDQFGASRTIVSLVVQLYETSVLYILLLYTPGCNPGGYNYERTTTTAITYIRYSRFKPWGLKLEDI